MKRGPAFLQEDKAQGFLLRAPHSRSTLLILTDALKLNHRTVILLSPNLWAKRIVKIGGWIQTNSMQRQISVSNGESVNIVVEEEDTNIFQ